MVSVKALLAPVNAPQRGDSRSKTRAGWKLVGRGLPVALLLFTLTCAPASYRSNSPEAQETAGAAGAAGAGEFARLPTNKAILAPAGRGINLNGWLSRAPAPGPDPGLSEKEIGQLRRLGFSFVRIPIKPEIFLAGNKLNEEHLGHIDQALDRILAQGLAVVVDLHPRDAVKREILGSDAALQSYSELLEAFAAHLSSRDPELVAFELLNEPYDPGTTDSRWNWNRIQRQFWAAARRGAPDHTLILSGDSWSSIGGLLRTDLIPDTNVVYTFHFYKPEIFTHQGANWGSHQRSFVRYLRRVPYPSTQHGVQAVLTEILTTIDDTHTADEAKRRLGQYGSYGWDREKLRRLIASAARWGRDHDVPLLAGEFGVYRRAVADEDRAAWTRDVREILEEHGIGWAMWEYSGGFGLVDERRNPDPELALALGLEVAQ